MFLSQITAAEVIASMNIATQSESQILDQQQQLQRWRQ